MLVLGLTGSAAMGKSTVAAMFADAGVGVFDADGAVHALYRGEATPLVEAAFPGTTADGVVDRDRLRQRVLGDEAAMRRLEALVHPLVRKREEAFRARAAAAGRRIILLDIPLLFEIGAVGRVDVVIVVSADADSQRRAHAGAAGHDRGAHGGDARPPDARRREAPAGAFRHRHRRVAGGDAGRRRRRSPRLCAGLAAGR